MSGCEPAGRHCAGGRNSFPFLTYDQVEGAFESTSVPVLAGGMGWRPTYVANGVTLTVMAAELPGDSDLDGDVDPFDLARLAANFGRIYGRNGFTTDPDHDGSTTLANLALLRSRLGENQGPLPGAAVPEPAGIGLVFYAGVSLNRSSRAA